MQNSVQILLHQFSVPMVLPNNCAFLLNISHYFKSCFDKNFVCAFQLNEWKDSTNHSFTFKVLPITFPLQGNTDEWKKLFKPCASQRLFLPVSISKVKYYFYIFCKKLQCMNMRDVTEDCLYITLNYVPINPCTKLFLATRSRKHFNKLQSGFTECTVDKTVYTRL